MVMKVPCRTYILIFLMVCFLLILSNISVISKMIYKKQRLLLSVIRQVSLAGNCSKQWFCKRLASVASLSAWWCIVFVYTGQFIAWTTKNEACYLTDLLDQSLTDRWENHLSWCSGSGWERKRVEGVSVRLQPITCCYSVGDDCKQRPEIWLDLKIDRHGAG